jgi:hypothetical protein
MIISQVLVMIYQQGNKKKVLEKIATKIYQHKE